MSNVNKKETPNMKKRPKIDFKIIGRILSYIRGKYRVYFCIAMAGTLISAFASVYGIMFLEELIDGHIAPMVETVLSGGVADYSSLLLALVKIAAIYIVGIVGNFACAYIMVLISQGVLKKIRDDMFFHMQTLPIKYFDTNAFGDLMSRYTNDTDTLEQMIAQSIPQIISTFVTVVIVLVAMIKTSWQPPRGLPAESATLKMRRLLYSLKYSRRQAATDISTDPSTAIKDGASMR
jgi:ATP-binding cassette subfamily B protein